MKTLKELKKELKIEKEKFKKIKEKLKIEKEKKDIKKEIRELKAETSKLGKFNQGLKIWLDRIEENHKKDMENKKEKWKNLK